MPECRRLLTILAREDRMYTECRRLPPISARKHRKYLSVGVCHLYLLENTEWGWVWEVATYIGQRIHNVAECGRLQSISARLSPISAREHRMYLSMGGCHLYQPENRWCTWVYEVSNYIGKRTNDVPECRRFPTISAREHMMYLSVGGCHLYLLMITECTWV